MDNPPPRRGDSTLPMGLRGPVTPASVPPWAPPPTHPGTEPGVAPFLLLLTTNLEAWGVSH